MRRFRRIILLQGTLDGRSASTVQQGRALARTLAGVLLALLALVLAGCASKSGGSGLSTGGRKAAIEELHMYSMPVALNMDGVPGPDGFVVRVYASSRASATGLAITSGTLEVLMFDGAYKENAAETPKPLRTWSYPANKLKQFLTQTSLGTGYRFALPWGDARPTQGHISVVARHLTRQGGIVASGPNTITVGAQ